MKLKHRKEGQLNKTEKIVNDAPYKPLILDNVGS